MSRVRSGLVVCSVSVLVVLGLGCGTASPLKVTEVDGVNDNRPIVKIPFSVRGLTIVEGEACADGTRLVTQAEFETHRAQVCAGLGQWGIVRLAGGGSADGPGYECKSRATDSRSLGGALCAASVDVEYSCYWLENYSGKYDWVTPPRGFYSGQGKARCQALDSCNGGGRASGGGCYKWAAGPKAPREPWD